LSPIEISPSDLSHSQLSTFDLDFLVFGLESQNLPEEMVQPDTVVVEAGMWKKVDRATC
jgi:hypothetical protein